LACIFLNAIGDHLLTLPALRALRSSARSAGEPFVLLVRPRLGDIFFSDLDPDVRVELELRYANSHYVFDHKGAADHLRALGHTRTLVSLIPWPSPLLDRFISDVKADRSVGYGSTFDVPLQPAAGSHSSDAAFEAARTIDPQSKIEQWSQPPVLPPGSAARATSFRRALGDRSLLAVHTDTKPEKLWVGSEWLSLADRWLEYEPSGVIIDVGLGDGSMWEGARYPDRMVTGLRLELDDAMAMVLVADRFVGVDSCFLHAADLGRVPTVGIFGPTSPAEFGCRWGPHRHLAVDPPADLTADRVFDAMIDVARESGSSRSAVFQ
jgi:hypothetical protein